jgi:hypothetical protein
MNKELLFAVALVIGCLVALIICWLSVVTGPDTYRERYRNRNNSGYNRDNYYDPYSPYRR